MVEGAECGDERQGKGFVAGRNTQFEPVVEADGL